MPFPWELGDHLGLDGGWDSGHGERGDGNFRSQQTLSGGFAGMSTAENATPWLVKHRGQERATEGLSLLAGVLGTGLDWQYS